MRATRSILVLLALAAIAPTGAAALGTVSVSAASASTAPASTSGDVPTARAQATAESPPATGSGPATASTPTTTSTSPPSTPSTPKPAIRTRIVALPATTISNGTAPVRIRLSGVPFSGSPMPALSPGVAGRWKAVGDTLTFTPASTLEPCSTYTLTVWAQTTVDTQLPLDKRRTLTLNVACPSIRGLQQALARLRYLPYTIRAAHGRNSGAKREARALAAHYAYEPPAAKLTANERDAPGLRYGTLDTTTRAAVMVFQGDHGQAPTGVPDRSTWISLLAAEALGHADPTPYTFVTVSESIPETLEVHRGGRVVLSSPANTGVPGAATEQGTFPIYARYVSTTMTGTDPDGTHYVDPGVPWVNYFNGGDAVHGFPRPGYGYPQSNGCVELPIATAEHVYPLLAIGDLVVVS